MAGLSRYSTLATLRVGSSPGGGAARARTERVLSSGGRGGGLHGAGHGVDSQGTRRAAGPLTCSRQIGLG